MPKEIKLAKTAGFCYGVKRAVETAKKLKSENPDKSDTTGCISYLIDVNGKKNP